VPTGSAATAGGCQQGAPARPGAAPASPIGDGAALFEANRIMRFSLAVKARRGDGSDSIGGLGVTKMERRWVVVAYDHEGEGSVSREFRSANAAQEQGAYVPLNASSL